MIRKHNKESTGLQKSSNYTPLTCSGCNRTNRNSHHYLKGGFFGKERAPVCVVDQHKPVTLPATFLERHSQLLAPFASSPTCYAKHQSMVKSSDTVEQLQGAHCPLGHFPFSNWEGS